MIVDSSVILFLILLQVIFFIFFSIKGGKSLKDEETLGSLEVNNGGKLYYKDLGTCTYH